MRLLAAATLSLLTMATAAQPQAGAQSAPPGGAPAAEPPCDPHARVEQARDRTVLRQPSARAQRLDQLPPGRLDLAVWRQVGGCPEPVTVAENFGAVDGPRAVRRPERTPAPPRTQLLGR